MKKLATVSGLTDFFDELSMEDQLKYAKRCKTTRRQIQNIIWGHSKASPSLALKLEVHGNGVDKAKLIWGDKA